MKNRMIAIAAIATTLIGGSAVFATNAIAQTPVPTTGANTAGARIEKHPEIRKAMRQLNNALTTMQHAADDFKGHKAAAILDAQQAIGELKAALNADKH